MYTLIDELVEAICKDEIYITYRNNAKHLEQGEIKRLLLQQQILQEDYMRLRDLEKYVSIDETKNQLKDIKQQQLKSSAPKYPVRKKSKKKVR